MAIAPVLCSRFILIPVLLYPGESCPLLEPSASSAHPRVLQTVAQLCDKIHPEKVMFSPLMRPRPSSLWFLPVSLLRTLGQSRRWSPSHFPGPQSPPYVSSVSMHYWRLHFHFFLELFSPSSQMVFHDCNTFCNENAQLFEFCALA